MIALFKTFRAAGFSVYSTPRGIEVSLCRPLGTMEIQMVLDRAGMIARIRRPDSRTAILSV